MTLLLPGIEYDIFISYRHNNNLPSQGFHLHCVSGGQATIQ
ncbi:MAG: hypothetical protein SH819_07030 [Cytophagales bacterium]|nr:hypothetical protein [Cytophagales bacterium]